ncbi:MAG: hypothetical protein WBK55_04800 [Alphaproteobacteria bacterium]
MTTPQTHKDDVMRLPKDPNAAMQEMMKTIDHLRSVYRRETEVLEAADTRAFLEMQVEKLKAARAYQDGIGQILERKDEMKKSNPLLRRRLEDMQKDFADLTAKNMDALKRMGRVAERLGNSVRVAAKDAAVRDRAFSYGETGTLKSSEKKSVSMGVSETA